jgi:hypothetical protein
MSIRLRHSSMARVVAVCGMPGSGKGEFANVLHSHGIPVLSMGDMVRAEVRRLELKESPGIFGEIAAQLRAEHGEDVLAVRLADAVDEHLKNNSIVLSKECEELQRGLCLNNAGRRTSSHWQSMHHLKPDSPGFRTEDVRKMETEKRSKYETSVSVAGGLNRSSLNRIF